MSKRRLVYLSISILLLLSTASVQPFTHQSEGAIRTSVINWEEVLQHIDGFGGSFAFHKAAGIYRLDEPTRTKLLDMVFSQENGIGISIVRSMVGDGGINEWGDTNYDGPSETIMPVPGEYVWDDPDWETKKEDFDKYQIWLMKEAKARGVKDFVSVVWSAPAWMKQNQSVLGSGQNNRLIDTPEMYQAFADYLAEYVLGYKEHFDLDINYISPTNEPDLGTGYSSMRWSSADLNRFVRDYLAPTFIERGVKAKIVLGETVGFNENIVRPALNDPVTVDMIDVVAAHAYSGLRAGGTEPDPNAFQLSNALGKTIWQTEYMNQGNHNQTYEHNTITDGMRYANLIGNMMDMTGISGYFWWWPVANNGADGSDLIRLTNTGTPQSGAPTENGMYRIFKRYYAFGNYSRFIQPGYERIATESRPIDDVLVTAYREDRTGNFTIVAVNNSTESQTLTFDLQQFPEPIAAVVPYRTSASENLKKLDDVSVQNSSFTTELRGMSVTTFIPKAFELPALEDLKDVFSIYEASVNDGMSPGLQTRPHPDGETKVTNIRNNTYIRYDNVNFADGSANGQAHKRGVLSMHAYVASLGGGKIEVRLDDPRKGKVVGTMDVPNSGDPDKWFAVSTMIDTNEVDGAYGIRDLYLVFTDGKNNRMFDVAYFSFGDGNLAPPIEVPDPPVDPEPGKPGKGLILQGDDIEVTIMNNLATIEVDAERLEEVVHASQNNGPNRFIVIDAGNVQVDAYELRLSLASVVNKAEQAEYVLKTGDGYLFLDNVSFNVQDLVEEIGVDETRIELVASIDEIEPTSHVNLPPQANLNAHRNHAPDFNLIWAAEGNGKRIVLSD